MKNQTAEPKFKNQVAVKKIETTQTDTLVRLSDEYWKPWFAELLKLAALHGIVTSDDADLWWDDCGSGKTPQESMDAFLAYNEGSEMEP
jgi:hypothetical protein